MPPPRDHRRRSGPSRRGTLLGFAAALTIGLPGHAAPTDAPPADLELAGSFDELQASLRQVIAELRSVSDDPTLNKLLDSTSLRLGRRLFALNPNAYAVRQGSTPIVEIDAAYVYRIMKLADYATLFWFSDAVIQPVAEKSAYDYGVRLRLALNAGQPPPDPEFNIDRAGLPPIETRLLSDLSQTILDTTLAWIVLHEIGHHALGHIARGPTSPTVSRGEEFAADRYGLEALLHIGYSPEPLRRLLGILGACAQLQRNAGYPVDNPESDHPPWDQRSKQIDALAQGHVIPNFPVQVVRYYGQDDDGKIISPAISYLTDPAVTRSLSMVGDGKIAVYERSGSTITIYGRSPSYRQEILVRNADRFEVDLSVRTVWPGRETTLRATGFNVNLATRKTLLPGTPNLPTALGQKDKIKVLNRRLLGQERGARVDAIQAQSADRILGYFSDYCKGVTDMRIYLQRAAKNAERYTIELRQAIGERDYPTYRDSIDRFLREQVMTEGVLGRLDRLQHQR